MLSWYETQYDEISLLYEVSWYTIWSQSNGNYDIHVQYKSEWNPRQIDFSFHLMNPDVSSVLFIHAELFLMHLLFL